MARVAAGDRLAVAALYDTVSAPVYATVRRTVRDRGLSDEVTQEVFVELWRTAARDDPDRGGVMTWCLTLARRRAVDRVRREQSHRDRIMSHGPAYGNDARPQDDVVVEVRDEARRARAALDRLPEPQRQAIEHAFDHDMSHAQIAAHLGVALGTVKTRIRDGLLRTRHALLGAA